jgi:cell division septation protein DedD
MKRQILTVLVILCLFATSFFGIQTAKAYTGTNLIPLSYYDDWLYVYGYASIDYVNITPTSQPSVKTTAGAYGTNEVNFGWFYTLVPGDHVVFSAWVKTDASDDEDMQAGAVIGFDLYVTGTVGSVPVTGQASDGVTTETHPNGEGGGVPGGEQGWGATSFGYTQFGEAGNICRIPWGTDWTYMEWDFTVPATYYPYVYCNMGSGNQFYALDSSEQIIGISPWSGHKAWDNPTYSYCGDTILYVNPSGEGPTPTPTPTATPTPSPSPSPSPTPIPSVSPTPDPLATPTPTPAPGVPTATPVVSVAQAATNNVFTNVYIALGILVVSTLIAGCYIIISSFNSGSGNARFGVGLVLISIVEVVIGVVIVSAFQGSMGTVAISLLSINGVT